ncbi:MAG: Cyclic di-GMP phosphodiesterase Gmr [Candidatus Accumulibacter appositus]|uniref:Cyclic di-GMP phosphodiesterase Gmr n=1 Tax=Candidatus Accumulibacter appositus TaxID=1454003 RepID=A0A011N8V7_9PROT|nr:diguanylate cyclase [Accumulibacter sp.]EXI79013.1 MAG: Cyclic di-GMP phosphodiesterase Gmr [Candidatus Accumulibacter appositus]HRF03232.1 diguanylate cyclase [Accumulibacter sp.]
MDNCEGVDRSRKPLSSTWASQVVEAIPMPMFVIDAKHQVVHWNRACEQLTGVAANSVLGTTRAWSAFYPSPRPLIADLALSGLRREDFERHYAGKFRPSPSIEGAWELEDFFPRMPDGGKWLVFSAAALRDESGAVVGAVETLRDVTAQRAAERAASDAALLLSEIVQGSPVPTFVIDAEHRVTHWNRACEAIVGASAEQMIGSREQWRPFYSHPRPVMADLVLDATEGQMGELYAGKLRPSPLIAGAWEARDYFPQFPGGGRWLYFTAAPLRGADGRAIGAVETLQDISKQKHYEVQLEALARHDSLTGLANRMVLEERLSLALSQAARHKRMLALAFLDLDHFKPINDAMGHAVGDALLVELAKRLRAMVRTADTVARIGGDEFVIVLAEPESREAVEGVIKRIIETVRQPFQLDEHCVQVGCSIGIALYPEGSDDHGSLLRDADAAMYLAKTAGRNGYRMHCRRPA